MGEKRNKSIEFFIIISILLHLVCLFLLRHLADINKLTEERRPLWVELKKPPQTKIPSRIADIPKPIKEEVPDQASAAALYNQKVKKETVRPGLPTPSKPSPPPSPPVKKKKKEAKKPAPKKSRKKKGPTVALKSTEPKKIEDQPPLKIPGIPGAHIERRTSPFPDDYFPDYTVGGRTYLNTLARPGIRYFVELKRKFRLAFNPRRALRGHVTRLSGGFIDVVLGVSVDSKGEMKELILIRSSDIDGYNYEGKRTIRSSAPFSSPPPNLLGKDGLLRMAWTFRVYF